MSGKRITYLCGLCGKEERRRIKDGEPNLSLCSCNNEDGTHLWIDSSLLDFQMRMKVKKSEIYVDAGYMYYLGNKYIASDPSYEYVKRAIKCFRKAYSCGMRIAMFKLGYMYYCSKYGIQDKICAIKCFRRAAQAGDYRAMLVLAIAYEEGKCVERNVDEAIMWYRKTAECIILIPSFSVVIWAGFMPIRTFITDVKVYFDSDNKDDLERLGYAYEKGVAGVNKNKDESIKYYLKACNVGSEYAMYSLGNAYANGEGVIQDKIKALEWYRKAVMGKLCSDSTARSLEEIIYDIFKNIDNG